MEDTPSSDKGMFSLLPAEWAQKIEKLESDLASLHDSCSSLASEVNLCHVQTHELQNKVDWLQKQLELVQQKRDTPFAHEGDVDNIKMNAVWSVDKDQKLKNGCKSGGLEENRCHSSVEGVRFCCHQFAHQHHNMDLSFIKLNEVCVPVLVDESYAINKDQVRQLQNYVLTMG